MSSYVPALLRRQVAERAHHVCEYCLIHHNDTFFGCQIEHIVSEKHDGPTTQDNLALACPECNQFKGSDVAAFSADTGQLIRLFNPRKDRWEDHFRLNGVEIRGISGVGKATVRLLCMNLSHRLELRETLRAIGRYPSPEAHLRMGE